MKQEFSTNTSECRAPASMCTAGTAYCCNSSTLSSKKTRHLIFDDNSDKCRLIFKILSFRLARKFCTYKLQRFPTWNVLLPYVLKLEKLQLLPISVSPLHVIPQNSCCQFCGHLIAQIWILMTTGSEKNAAD